MRKYAASVALQALSVGVLGTPASAETITITGGQLAMGSFAGELFVNGDRDFTLSAAVLVVDSFFGPDRQCDLLLACIPGAPLDLGAAFIGSSLHSTTVTLDGRTFTDVTNINALTSAGVWFAGSTIAPPLMDGMSSVTGPFTFEGQFSYPGGADVIREMLIGQGTATITLRPLALPGLPPRWQFVSAQYQFSAVPEPATVLLTGSGMIGVAALRRRFRRRTTVRFPEP